MDTRNRRELPLRNDDRIIIHFDYDCFYASVFEAENPALKSLPLAVQQKHIIVTCNYEARRRGLHKLQLITEAKRLCPDVIIVLGEDISRFRNASKELYTYLERFSWSKKVERLGFDEVWMDMTDMIDYNQDILNHNDLDHSFFQLVKDDPTKGFEFSASCYAGHLYPESTSLATNNDDDFLSLRLRLGSHLAMHIRHQLEHEKGYTSTVGISTNKILSKLVGNLNKPKGQTTLVPPYTGEDEEDSVHRFLDGYDIGKVPNIGFKMAQKLREHILGHSTKYHFGMVDGGMKETVTVKDVRTFSGMDPEQLGKLFSGPGAPHGIGYRIWTLLHGIDETEVGFARAVPRQISIEDSYIRLDTLPEVTKELLSLARSLMKRMRVDLLVDDVDAEMDDISDTSTILGKRWLAHPKTLRLTTRPKAPLNADGSRARTFKRISHSAPLPQFVFGYTDSIDTIAERLVNEALLSMFRKLHPEKQGWNLSLINIAVTNMAEAAGDSKSAKGRDIGNMFRKQDEVLKDFRVLDESEQAPLSSVGKNIWHEIETDAEFIKDEDDDDDVKAPSCAICGLELPAFAMAAHLRYHALGD